MYPMNKSINKWIRMKYGGTDEGRFNCNLCKKYYQFNCTGCPVKNYTSLAWCKNTPYEVWIEHQKHYHGNIVYTACCSVCDDIINSEIEFLKDVKINECAKRRKKNETNDCKKIKRKIK